MQSVTVSPKYQIVIPKNNRKSLKLQPGPKMQVIEYAGRIELIPERNIKELQPMGSKKLAIPKKGKTPHPNSDKPRFKKALKQRVKIEPIIG